MKSINVKFIEEQDQRYETCGDYWEEPMSLEVRVTKYRNNKYAQLILIHELIEMFLCEQRGIKFDDIDEFDRTYAIYDDEGEPGDDPVAPYHKEHVFATKIEKLIAAEMGVDWFEYETTVELGETAPIFTEDYE